MHQQGNAKMTVLQAKAHLPQINRNEWQNLNHQEKNKNQKIITTQPKTFKQPCSNMQTVLSF